VLINFFRVESCGKCTPCRIGTKRAHDLLEGISRGKGTLEDLDSLQALSQELLELSNCGLGQTAGTPIKDMLAYFRAEVEAHIRLGICPVGVCPMHD
jgi:NADH:ubiquinone oxidoreductase subunit F (NADH-binding)